MKFLNKYKSFLTPEQKKERNRQLLFGLAAGVLFAASYPPVPTFFLSFVALVPYLAVIEKRKSLADINRITYFTFFIFSVLTIYWVGSWMSDTDPFLIIAGIALLFFNPILFLIPSTLYYFAKKQFGSKIALVLFPLFWVTYEYVYSLTDIRFPWLTAGNSVAYFTPFIQIADIIGVYGISLLILYINIFAYKIYLNYINKTKLKPLHIAGLLLLYVIPLVYGFIKINTYEESREKVTVGVVQPDFNPWLKWEAGNIDEQLDVYLNLSRKTIENGAEVLMWPETALPVYLLSGSHYRQADRIHSFLDSNNVFLLTGMPHAEFYFDTTKAPKDAKPLKNSDALYTSYNSALFFRPGSREVGHYGKIKLVPFGEKVPYVEYIPFLGDLIKWNVGISSWNTGTDTAVFKVSEDKLFRTGSEKDTIGFAGVVCIESIYSDFIASFVQRGANVLAVVTNDSWYGYSSGPFQHKSISNLRAVENRRSVVRAANGGISCYINALGETIYETKLFTRDQFTVNIEIRNEETFYTAHPLIVPILCSVVSIWMLGIFILFKLKEKFYGNKNE